jgi:hypothetical protein
MSAVLDARPLRVTVFGKPGCDKCAILKKRLADLMAKPDYALFDLSYADVETVEGLTRFCRAEELNPNRIPAFVIERYEEGEWVAIESPPAEGDPSGRLACRLGMQTDYSGAGRGVIPPKAIAGLLDRARVLAAPATPAVP